MSHERLERALRGLRAARPPVLLLGGLDLLRPLGFAGIPALVATPDPRDPALASRYCRGSWLLPPLEARAAVLESLLDAGRRLHAALGRRVPLYYCNDDTLSLASESRAALAEHYLLLLNPPPLAQALLDKERFRALARERGLPVPRTLAWEELAGATGPVVLKPRRTRGCDRSAARLRLLGAGKARVFRNGRRVLAHPLAVRLRDELSFQEFVAGDDRCLWSFHGFADERGQLLAAFVGRKLRTYPAFTGMSSYLELAHDAAIDALGREVVARVPLRGVFKIDVKRDAVSGRDYVLEVNARFNLWHHPGARNGVNLPQVAYDYLVDGARPAAAPACVDEYRWLCPRLDRHAYREAARRGELTLGAWLASLAAAPKVYDLFSWTDPLPWLLHFVRRAPARLRRAASQLGLRLARWRSTAY